MIRDFVIHRPLVWGLKELPEPDDQGEGMELA
jgi:hypothetical protein